MGMTIRAELNYGYVICDFHGDGYQFAEVDVGEPTATWWDGNGDSFDEQAMTYLRAAAGFTETEWSERYYDRMCEADEKIGVEFEHTGYEGGRTLLVAKGRKHDTEPSGTTMIDPVFMGAATDGIANEALSNALRTLGITPRQEKPAWLLTCYYG